MSVSQPLLDTKEHRNDSNVLPVTECSFELPKVVEKGTGRSITARDSFIVEAVVIGRDCQLSAEQLQNFFGLGVKYDAESNTSQ